MNIAENPQAALERPWSGINATDFICEAWSAADKKKEWMLWTDNFLFAGIIFSGDKSALVFELMFLRELLATKRKDHLFSWSQT